MRIIGEDTGYDFTFTVATDRNGEDAGDVAHGVVVVLDNPRNARAVDRHVAFSDILD